MRAWSVAALVVLVALPGASCAKEWWEAAGTGSAQESGFGDCAALYQLGLERTGATWYTHLEVYAYPNRDEILGCLPRGYVFPGVTGSPQFGWEATVTVACAITHIDVEPIGNLYAGVAEFEWFYGDFCTGLVDRGSGILAFATPDV